LISGEILEILKAIMAKLEDIEKRLIRIEEELFYELSEEELKEIKRDLEAYERCELEVIPLEELKKELGIDGEEV